MNQTAIFWPMLAHVLLVYIAYGALRVTRADAVRSGSATIDNFRIRGAEPDKSAAAFGNVLNQFELPLLFHICCLSLVATAGVNYATLALAWLFIVTRYVHAWVHLTSNRVRYRAMSFIAGFFVLGLMWIWFALHLAGLL